MGLPQLERSNHELLTTEFGTKRDLLNCRSGSLSLHGWMRDDETSVVAAFDPASGKFSD